MSAKTSERIMDLVSELIHEAIALEDAGLERESSRLFDGIATILSAVD